MIELVVVYCLISDPTHCMERRDPLTDYDSLTACADRAELIAGEFLRGHPKWKLTTFRCEMDKPQEDPA